MQKKNHKFNFEILSVQLLKICCVMYRACFLAVLLFPIFMHPFLLSNSRSRLMCFSFVFFRELVTVSCLIDVFYNSCSASVTFILLKINKGYGNITDTE